MIDWYSVGFGALWTLGLGLVLAALSFASYLAGRDKRPLTQVLALPEYQTLINLGLVFFCLGWAGSVSTTWEHLLWAILAFIFVAQAWQARKISNV